MQKFDALLSHRELQGESIVTGDFNSVWDSAWEPVCTANPRGSRRVTPKTTMPPRSVCAWANAFVLFPLSRKISLVRISVLPVPLSFFFFFQAASATSSRLVGDAILDANQFLTSYYEACNKKLQAS